MNAFTTDPNKLAENVMSACEEAHSMASSYINAATKANKAAWKGIEDMVCDMGALVQESCNRSVEACKTIMSSRSPQEAADKHAEFMRECFDGIVATGGKMSQLTMRATKETMEPLTQHANDAMGAIMKKAANAG